MRLLKSPKPDWLKKLRKKFAETVDGGSEIAKVPVPLERVGMKVAGNRKVAAAFFGEKYRSETTGAELVGLIEKVEEIQKNSKNLIDGRSETAKVALPQESGHR